MIPPLTELLPDDVSPLRRLLERGEFDAEYQWMLAAARLEGLLQEAAAAVSVWDRGEMVACGLANAQAMDSGTRQALVRVAVRADWRRQGIGSALLEEITARVRAADQSPGRIDRLALFAWMPCDGAREFAERAGFESVHFYHRMERPAVACASPVWPDGITVRTFDGSEEMLERWNTAYNAGFVATWRYRPGTLADCRRLAEAPGFHPDNVIIAFAGGEPAGLVRVAWEEGSGGADGIVEIVGVVPAQRSRGLGRALLRAGLQRLGSRKCRWFRLIVDAESPVAPSLYQSEGFASAAMRQIWEGRL